MKMLHLKDNKKVLIKAIMIEGHMSEPEATILWEKYKHFKLSSFRDYLIFVNPKFIQDRYYIDFIERVKVRTKILKRGYYEKVSVGK